MKDERSNIKRIVTRADIVLLVALIIVGVLIWAATAIAASSDNATWKSPGTAATSGNDNGESSGSAAGNIVVIKASGKTYGTYSLSRDRVIVINKNDHHNKVIIKSGKVRMASSDCANKVCVHAGTIDKPGQSIICLPNRVTVKITGEGGYDAVAG